MIRRFQSNRLKPHYVISSLVNSPSGNSSASLHFNSWVAVGAQADNIGNSNIQPGETLTNSPLIHETKPKSTVMPNPRRLNYRNSVGQSVQDEAKRRLSSIYTRSKKMRKRLSIGTNNTNPTRRRLSQLWSPRNSPIEDLHLMFEIADTSNNYSGRKLEAGDANAHVNVNGNPTSRSPSLSSRKHHDYKTYYTQELSEMNQSWNHEQKKNKKPRDRDNFLTGNSVDSRESEKKKKNDFTLKQTTSPLRPHSQDHDLRQKPARERYKLVHRHLEEEVPVTFTQDLNYASNVNAGTNAGTDDLRVCADSNANLNLKPTLKQSNNPNNHNKFVIQKITEAVKFNSDLNKSTFLLKSEDLSNTFDFLPRVSAVSDIKLPLISTADLLDQTTSDHNNETHSSGDISNTSTGSKTSNVSSIKFDVVYQDQELGQVQGLKNKKNKNKNSKSYKSIRNHKTISRLSEVPDETSHSLHSSRSFDGYLIGTLEADRAQNGGDEETMWRRAQYRSNNNNNKRNVNTGGTSTGGVVTGTRRRSSISSLFSSSSSPGKSTEKSLDNSHSGSSDLLTELSPIAFDKRIFAAAPMPAQKPSLAATYEEESILPSPPPMVPKRADEHFMTQSEIFRIEVEERDDWKSKPRPKSRHEKHHVNRYEDGDHLGTSKLRYVTTFPISPETSPTVASRFPRRLSNNLSGGGSGNYPLSIDDSLHNSFAIDNQQISKGTERYTQKHAAELRTNAYTYLPHSPASPSELAPIQYGSERVDKDMWSQALVSPGLDQDYQWDDINANLDKIQSSFHSLDQDQIRREIEDMLDQWR